MLYGKGGDGGAGPKSFEEKLARYSSLGKSPRGVPLLLILSMIINDLFLFGAFFFGFGMIFVWVFFQPEDIYRDYLLNSKSARANGRVIEVKPTNVTVNEQEIYRINYEFETPQGVKPGFSHIAGDPQLGDGEVIVEYMEGDPTVSRIQGTQKSVTGPWTSFVIIFPLVGFCISAYQAIRGAKIARILRNGEVAQATVTGTQDTNVRVNEQQLFNVTFTFQDHSGREHTFTHNTTDVWSVTDEPAELVFYDSENPEDARPIDDLPSEAQVSPQGEWQSPPPVGVLIRAAIAAACIVPHVIYGFVKYGF